MNSTDWVTIKATDYCLKVADGTHDSPKRAEKGKPLITSKHIKGKSIDFDSAYLISDNDFHKINLRSKVDQWDVLISMIGEYCGYCYIEANEAIDYAVKNVGIFKTGKKIKALWLYYYLNSPIGKDILKSLRSGTSQPYISLGALRALDIAMPTQEIRMEKIVSILSSLDDKIELNRQTNQTLEAIAQALFKEWFVEFKFPGATDEMQESELGEIPKGWRVGKLADVCNITMGQSPPGSSYNLNGEGVIFFQGRAEFGYRFPTIDKYTNDPKRFANENDILLSVRAPVGSVNIAMNRCCIGRGLAAISGKGNFSSFAFYLLRNLEEQFVSFNGEGTVFGSINKTDLENIKIAVAPKNLILIFDTTARSIDEKIKNNEIQIQTLTRLRDILLPKLMKGEIEIN